MGLNAQNRRKVRDNASRYHGGATFKTLPPKTLFRRKKNKGLGHRSNFQKMIRAKWLLGVITRLPPLWTKISRLTNQL